MNWSIDELQESNSDKDGNFEGRLKSEIESVEHGSGNFLAGDNSDGDGHKPMGSIDWSHSNVEFCKIMTFWSE